MKNYKELKVWKKSIEVVKDAYQLISLLPNNEIYGLSSQMARAVVSIPSSIAEGSSRSSDKEYIHFLEIALGSAFEIETQLIICDKVYNKIEFDIKKLILEVIEIQMMLASFITTIKKGLKLKANG